MSSRAVTLLGFFVIALSIFGLEVIAIRPFTKVAHLDQVIQFLLHTRSGKIHVFAIWAWSEIHFFGYM